MCSPLCCAGADQTLGGGRKEPAAADAAMFLRNLRREACIDVTGLSFIVTAVLGFDHSTWSVVPTFAPFAAKTSTLTTLRSNDGLNNSYVGSRPLGGGVGAALGETPETLNESPTAIDGLLTRGNGRSRSKTGLPVGPAPATKSDHHGHGAMLPAVTGFRTSIPSGGRVREMHWLWPWQGPGRL